MSSDSILTSTLGSNTLSLQTTKKTANNEKVEPSTPSATNQKSDTPTTDSLVQTNLSSRAQDLSTFLDNINYSAKVIESASKGIDDIQNVLKDLSISAQDVAKALQEGDTEALENFAEISAQAFQEILTIVENSNYKGTNLLNGETLTTELNQHNTNNVSTSGLTVAEEIRNLPNAVTLKNIDEVLATQEAINALIDKLDTYQATLSNDQGEIQSRADFAQLAIDTLNAGAQGQSASTPSEEAANLLALQASQALSLDNTTSLGSDSAQNILKLF